MDSSDQRQPVQQNGTDCVQLQPDYSDSENVIAHHQHQLHELPVDDGGEVYATEWQESQMLPNSDLEGQLRNMIMHHSAGMETYESSPQLPHPMTNTGNDNSVGNHPTSEQNGHGMPPLHPHMEMPQPYPPHFLQGGYAPLPPMFMHTPPPGMYPPHIPLHPYPIPYDGQMLPYPMLQPFPLPQFPPPGYVPMPPDQVPIAGFAEPMDSLDGQVPNPPSAPRQFERNGPRHQRNHSYPKQHQKYNPRRQYDHGPPVPRPSGPGFQPRQQQQQQQQLPLPPQPGLINDDFPPLGTERPKTKTNTIPAIPEPTNQQEAMNGSRRGFMSGPPSGPRYRGGSRNFGPRNQQYHMSQERQQQQQQPYQPSPQELAVLTEVATEQIALATPSAEELEHKTKLRERLQKLCTNVSPTAELKAFGSLVSGFATVGSDLDLVLVDKGGSTDRPFFEIPLLLEQEFKDNGLEAQLLAKTRVPILKIKQPATEEYPKDVAADIGFANSLAIRNTGMLSMYSKCDPRVIDMVRFIKRWAKQRKINNPYRGTLSSYGYVLMVLHYLINIVEPPVLPNLQLYPIPAETPKDEVTAEGHNVWYYKDVVEIERRVADGTMTTNTMDLPFLLLGFFEFYAYRFGWVKDIISIRTQGGLISKMDKGWVAAAVRVGKSETEYKDRYLFAIEDPFEINHNVSRTCNFYGVRKIRDELRRANRILRMREGEAALRYKLFEEAPEEVRPQNNHKQGMASEEHVNGTLENGGEDGERNQLVGEEEGRNGHGNGNRVHSGEGYPELAAVVEGVQGLSVDA